MSLRAWLLALALPLVGACGSKTALSRGERDGGMDAGFDAGRRDAGLDAGAPRPDAGPPGCERSATIAFESSDPTTVILLIDASSSMGEPFGDGLTRWQAVRAALTGPGAAIERLEARVPFGLVRYSAVVECPIVDSLPAALLARDGIDALLVDLPGGATPTAEAMAFTRAELPRLRGAFAGPVSFVLATDGEPSGCDGRVTSGNPERAAAVAEVRRAFDAGVRTFVLSVGAGVSDAHLADLANAGAGVAPGQPDAPTWRADDPASLAEVVAAAVDAASSCVATLPWPVAGCAAEVTLGGLPVACDDPDGYAIDGDRITFAGSACRAWESGLPAVVRPGCE